jgi:hypothetical protein
VLPAWPTARAETPFQLSGWDDEMAAPNPQAASCGAQAVCPERQPLSGSGRGQRSHERKTTVNGCLAETTPQLGADNPSNYGAHNRPDEGDWHHSTKQTSSRHRSRHGPGGTPSLLGPLFEIIVHGPPPASLRSA